MLEIEERRLVSLWWQRDGGGSGDPDPGCREHGEDPWLMGDRGFIGFVLGGPPMQLSKPVRAMVFFRILRRRSAAACGIARGCNLAKVLFVILFFPEGLSAKCVDSVLLGLSTAFGCQCVVMLMFEMKRLPS
jgi:hypothetical protein